MVEEEWSSDPGFAATLSTLVATVCGVLFIEEEPEAGGDRSPRRPAAPPPLTTPEEEELEELEQQQHTVVCVVSPMHHHAAGRKGCVSAGQCSQCSQHGAAAALQGATRTPALRCA